MKPYQNIDFEKFYEKEVTLTKEEQKRITERFYESIGQPKKKAEERQRRTAFVAAACACLIITTAVTPIGDKAWAAVREAFIGIGEFLGLDVQDSYATAVNQTQTKNGITVTLHDVIGNDRELQYSLSIERDDGSAVSAGKVVETKVLINGEEVGEDIQSAGTGIFGSDTIKDSHGMGFLSARYDNYEMPVNPNIQMSFDIEGVWFTFDFTLQNEAFKKATKEIPMDLEVPYKGRVLHFAKMVVTPMDTVICLKNPEEFDFIEDRISIYGVDNEGNQIVFDAYPDYTFVGYRYDDDTTAMLNPNAKWYQLRVYDPEKVELDHSKPEWTAEELWPDESAISDWFTVKIK